MTRAEAIKQLKDNRLLCINSETEPFAIAYDMAIKALEQEPSKPMVEIDLYSVIKQKYIEREVLDKLRAELHATAEMHENGGYYIRDEWIDEYFDKYKGETENP